MTLEEIARAMGVQTAAEVAAALGLAVEDIRPEMPRPTLVLDFRGESVVRGWERMAKAEISGVMKKLPHRLDPRTGLVWKRKRA